MIWTKTYEAIASSASVVATAMMIGYTVHLMANAVHPSGAPEVQHGLHSTLDGNPVHQLTNTVHPSEAPDVHVHDGICSTPVGKYSTPSGAPDLHDRICNTSK